MRDLLLGLHSMCRGADSRFFNGHTNITNSTFLVFCVKGLDNMAENLRNTLLFSLLLVLYRQHGHWQIKPAIFAALLLWCVLDSSISAYFDLWLHTYLNSAAALAIALPLWALRPLRACR